MYPDIFSTFYSLLSAREKRFRTPKTYVSESAAPWMELFFKNVFSSTCGWTKRKVPEYDHDIGQELLHYPCSVTNTLRAEKNTPFLNPFTRERGQRG